MKARFFALAALVLGMVSCQQDFDAAPQVGGEVDFQLSVAAPELGATRATDLDGDEFNGHDSAFGAIDYLTEADWGNVDLRYSLEVYDVADSYVDAVPVKDRLVKIVDKYQPVKFDLRLVPNRNYHFVVFADFVPQGASSEANTDVQRELGFRHNIGDNLGKITIKSDAINDEYTDAYFATKDIVIENSAAQDIVLKRPYAKVRVIATDLNELNLNVNPGKVQVEYDAFHPSAFNAVTGEVAVDYETRVYSYDYAASVSKESLADHYYTADYDAMKAENANGVKRHTHMTIFTDYILAKDEQESIHFTMKVSDKDGGLIKQTYFNTDIPVQRNYLTTIVGNVLTTATEINVTIDDNFAGNNYVGYKVESAAELAGALTADKTNINVVLANDIDLPISMLGQQTGGSGEYKLGGEQTKSITIDLNGKKLNITTNYWSGIGAKNADALFTIKNGTMTSSQPTGTWNSYDLCFANCNYSFENVDFEKAIALESAGKTFTLKNITINETHDYYAMWISAKGQTVNIDGLTINATAGRGIKIDEQYVDAPAKVTLNVKNATFNTAKKAAILVKSVEGADITVSNIDIANVKADGTHVVWVDEDAKAYADKVTVNGGLMIVEGAASASAFTVESATIELAPGNYNFPAKVANGVTIKGDGVVMNMSDSFNMSYVKNLTLDGITVNWKGATYTGFTHSSGHLYKNVTFNGAFFCYGQSAKFEGCTFNLNCNQYVWTYASDVDFEKCIFNCFDGKGVLVYNEGVAVDVNFTGCEFSSSKKATTGTGEPIAAIEISNSVNNPVFNVNIEDCTSKGGFAYDEYICRVKNDAKSMKNLNITVDGAIVVSNADEIAAALTADKANVGVVLANDIDLPISKLGQQTGGSGEYKLGGEQTENISIDLNGYKLNITTTYWSGIGAKNDNALFTIKNGTMTSSQSTGTWNSYDLTFANCNYVIEDVVFEKAIAFAATDKSASLKNVTINETHDYYAMWICAEGLNVTADKLTINSLGRGIKIDEQYIDALAKVTLTVKNSKFTTAKKAAIMVKSAAGAEINVENLDITGVAADTTNAVWVDEDAATYFDLVTVNGASKKQE